MKKYTEHELLKLAKRFHNTKRTYLLVDPLQGKHLPVRPSEALEMLHTFGELVSEKYPETKLVIGFAETATAVGMNVAEKMGEDCIYIHTTRENIPSESEWIEFLEEHSHATDQKLSASNLGKWLADTETVVFVDDEISTGKTIINFIEQLKKNYPEVNEKKLVAASIINRVTQENKAKMESCGIESISLIKLEDTDFTENVKKFDISEAEEINEDVSAAGYEYINSGTDLMDPRLGVKTREYVENCQKFANEFLNRGKILDNQGNILILGTEECMYPAIVLGETIEKNTGANVYTHSTTRSPIGICGAEGYPITSGYRIKSLYDDERKTYIYDLKKYDLVIIVTDSERDPFDGKNSLVEALFKEGNENVVLYRG
ncbi:MAG: phosphoribosyltransferase domain-containing protein [Butyrivibrio sp.]|nr:phosphoribosyltransferase domain-containing protein [Butyrivibrio sp.]